MPSPAFRTIVLAALCVALPAVARASDATNSTVAESTIQHFSDGLLDIMKRADDLGLAGRADTIAPVVEECFDLAFMARATIGRTWTSISPGDQQRWVEAFSAYTIYKLASRFDGFSGQSFEIVGQKPASRGTLTVLTELRRPTAEDVRLDYRMRETDSGWKVIDIYSKGRVSEVALRRSEYAPTLRSGGIDLLIESVSAVTQGFGEVAQD